ncbi:hypothetical protein [Luteolibacter sp. Populi]|uniref:hypothetical protein n=1 Tax=Luteolibacter sp. Populi TaxID=3230487 RepID=UPI003466C9A1
MDNLLESLWRTGEKPFHAETVYPLDDVFVRDAIVAIRSALGHIACYYPSARLFALDDWHEHDGIITAPKATRIEELREQVGSAEAYVKNHSDDTFVYRAIYPDSMDFVLRYCLGDDAAAAPSSRTVHWTFTGYGHDIAEIHKRWHPYRLASEPSVAFFQERYAG